MKVLITGTSSGIGRATAIKFIEEGHEVVGLDIQPSSIDERTVETIAEKKGGSYRHYTADIADLESADGDLLACKPQILIDNAGVQDSGHDIDVNLKGTIAVTEHFAMKNPDIRSVVIVGSASGITGSEFPEYAASKGGLVAYTKNIALRLAPRATANSVCPGGVVTDLNRPVMEDEKLWKQIMELTPLKRWAEPEEIAEWIYFLAVTNRFMTGQNLLIDGGEAGDMHFIWPE